LSQAEDLDAGRPVDMDQGHPWLHIVHGLVCRAAHTACANKCAHDEEQPPGHGTVKGYLSPFDVYSTSLTTPVASNETTRLLL
jgi:hypothetical protein